MKNSIDKDLNDLIAYMNGDEHAFDDWPEPNREHGALLEYRQEAYHDVYVFEDGHEERHYIGD